MLRIFHGEFMRSSVRRIFIYCTCIAMAMMVLAAASVTPAVAQDTVKNAAKNGTALIRPTDLRCEMQNEPLAIDTANPRLSWVPVTMDPTTRGVLQRAYRLRAATTPDTGSHDLWDSGWVESDESLNIRYAGKPLPMTADGRTTVFWTVQLRDAAGNESAESEPARFTLGLCVRTDDQKNTQASENEFADEFTDRFAAAGARWITAPSDNATLSDEELRSLAWYWTDEEPAHGRMYPTATRVFRKSVPLTAAEAATITQATFILTADNRYQLFVAGHEIGSGDNYRHLDRHEIPHELLCDATAASTFHTDRRSETPGKISRETATALADHVDVRIVATNDPGNGPNEAGVIGAIVFVHDDGSRRIIPIDETWESERPADASPVGAIRGGVTKQAPYGDPVWGEVRMADNRSAPVFQREFQTKSGTPLRRAILSICGLGVYRATLDGNRIGDTEQSPAWSNYRRTCYYDTYDVTPVITNKNTLMNRTHRITVELGNGMYNVVGGRYVKFTGSFGPPKLILHMNLEYADGSVETLVSDEAWLVDAGPTVFNCIYGGEDYDARRESADSMNAKTPVLICEGPGGALRATILPSMKVRETLPTVRVTEPKPGIFVYDLGQNHSGFPTLEVIGAGADGGHGKTVKMTPGELLSDDGLVSQRSSGGPVSFSYTLRGSGLETWTPRFSYYGYRYVQVEGAVPTYRTLIHSGVPIRNGNFLSGGSSEHEGTAVPYTISADAEELPRVVHLTGNWIWNDSDSVGSLRASDPKVEEIHRLILAAIRCNFQNVLTDCPHREKLGWLEVSQLLFSGIAYNFDAQRFYAKITHDGIESQCADGLIPDIAPEYVVFQGGFRDSPEWGAAIGICSQYAEDYYADRDIRMNTYETVKRYAAYLESTMVDGLVQHGLGDWYDIGPNGPGASQLTSLGITATGAYYQTLTSLRRTAIQLGLDDDAADFSTRMNTVKRKFNETYFHPDTHVYDRIDAPSQTAQAVPLVVGLVPEEERAAVLESLVRIVHRDGDRVTAGDVGFSYVVRALTDGGQGELLWKIIGNEGGPGYCDQLRKGATTLTEAWDAGPGSSQNHCMLGHAEEWFWRGLAGIRCDTTSDGAGFRRFTLAPQMVDGLSWAEAEYRSVHGMIRSRWSRESANSDGNSYALTYECTIPVGTTATIRLPIVDEHDSLRESDHLVTEAPGVKLLGSQNGETILEAESGMYRFTWR